MPFLKGSVLDCSIIPLSRNGDSCLCLAISLKDKCTSGWKAKLKRKVTSPFVKNAKTRLPFACLHVPHLLQEVQTLRCYGQPYSTINNFLSFHSPNALDNILKLWQCGPDAIVSICRWLTADKNTLIVSCFKPWVARYNTNKHKADSWTRIATNSDSWQNLEWWFLSQ